MPPPLDHPSLHLSVLPNDFFVLQPPERFFPLTRTVEEVSVVGEVHKDLSKRYHDNSGWRRIRIAGPMEFSILASFTLPLREVQVPVFGASTWNTDYVLVPKDKLEVAVGALKTDGWTFIS
ncbi:hypothetical protein IW262DRAFT_1452125 [Armillaria fumosa]|nr:hypothetical protein IW262DRAFT_1452125 [Armillaria fumosa]